MNIEFKINYQKFNEVMGNPNLSPGAKVTLWWLLQHGAKNGNIYPSQKRLSERLGRGTRQIRYYLNELIKYGIIVDRWRDSYQSSNNYLINEDIYCPSEKIQSESPEIGGLSNTEVSTEVSVSSSIGNRVPVHEGIKFPPNNKELNNKENNNLSYQRDEVDKSTSTLQPVKTDCYECENGLIFSRESNSVRYCSCYKGELKRRGG